jgi:hypothetical protein
MSAISLLLFRMNTFKIILLLTSTFCSVGEGMSIYQIVQGKKDEMSEDLDVYPIWRVSVTPN